MKFVNVCLFNVILATALSSYALNYHELSVYNYETADPHETEFENSTSVTSDNILRTSFEINHGITDKTEVAGYVDYKTVPEEKMKVDSFRAHVRTSFFKKGERQVDMGLYMEVELPQDSDESYAIDSKMILEKDFGRFRYVLTPALEFVKLKEMNSTGESSEIEKHYAAKVSYDYSDKIQPHVDLIGEISDDAKQLVLMGVDYSFTHGLGAAVSIGKGTTRENTENLLLARLEYEIY